jgi:hypothetical protein
MNPQAVANVAQNAIDPPETQTAARFFLGSIDGTELHTCFALGIVASEALRHQVSNAGFNVRSHLGIHLLLYAGAAPQLRG